MRLEVTLVVPAVLLGPHQQSKNVTHKDLHIVRSNGIYAEFRPIQLLPDCTKIAKRTTAIDGRLSSLVELVLSFSLIASSPSLAHAKTQNPIITTRNATRTGEPGTGFTQTDGGICTWAEGSLFTPICFDGFSTRSLHTPPRVLLF